MKLLLEVGNFESQVLETNLFLFVGIHYLQFKRFYCVLVFELSQLEIFAAAAKLVLSQQALLAYLGQLQLTLRQFAVEGGDFCHALLEERGSVLGGLPQF
jgi:hypothetical protein